MRRAAFTLTELLVVIAVIALLAGLLLPVLSRAREGASAVKCTSHMRQIVAAAILFANEHDGQLPRLHVDNWLHAAVVPEAVPVEKRIVTNPNVYFWTEMLEPYVKSRDVFSCPKLQKPAINGPGGGRSTHYPLGIGINYSAMAPNGGTQTNGSGSYPWTRMLTVPEPGRVVWFADAAGDYSGPWQGRPDEPGHGACFFRGNTDDGVGVMPRHHGRVNVAFADGHVVPADPEAINWGKSKVGNFIGYSYF